MIKNNFARKVIRVLIRQLTRLIGFNNLLLIFKKEIDEVSMIHHESVTIIQYPFEVREFNGLKNKIDAIKHNYNNQSVLVCYHEKTKIVGYMWGHKNYDPMDVIHLDEGSYCVIGPSFVDPAQRGKGISGKMRSILNLEMKKDGIKFIASKTSYDNFSQIRAASKAGYKLHSAYYKTNNINFYL